MIMCQLKCLKTNIPKTVLDFLGKLPYEIKGKNICVCLSGGADSVALLRAFLLIKDRYSLNISACHFNHCIRGEEADSDECFCKKLCDNLGVEIFLGRDDVIAHSKTNKLSVEESARICRYAFFSRILAKKSIDFCATAHNMNDDAETLLLNLIRGSGVNGASAIEPYNKSYLRPFLSVKREEIEQFLSEIGQDFITDSTNYSNDYTRNYLRNSVFPLLQSINPSVTEAFSRFVNSSRVDRDYFESTVSDLIDHDLRELHSALRSRIILRKYKEFSGKILNASLVNEIDKSLFADKRVIVPIFGDDEAIIDNGKVIFKKNISEDMSFSETTLEDGKNTVFDNKVTIYLNACYNNNDEVVNSQQYLNVENICGSIKVRQRITGDKIIIKGVNKSLKKLFIDNKIPKEYRNIIPIFFDEKGIIYVPFVGISDRVFSKKCENMITITTVFNTIDKERWSLSYEE